MLKNLKWKFRTLVLKKKLVLNKSKIELASLYSFEIILKKKRKKICFLTEITIFVIMQWERE